LHLNIVPVLMHGVHYTMTKGGWLLKDGTTTVKLYPGIPPDDSSFGEGYKERSKQIRKWMSRELKKEKSERETPGYFKEQIIKGNLYNGPVLEWYCKIKIRLEGYYEVFHQILPREGRFYDLGCG